MPGGQLTDLIFRILINFCTLLSRHYRNQNLIDRTLFVPGNHESFNFLDNGSASGFENTLQHLYRATIFMNF